MRLFTVSAEVAGTIIEDVFNARDEYSAVLQFLAEIPGDVPVLDLEVCAL